MELQADSIQGVIFVQAGHQQDDALKIWARLFPNDAPDSYQRASPSASPGAAIPSLTSTASGEREGCLLTLSVQVGRIDILLSQPAPVTGVAVAPPRIADVAYAARRLAELLKSCTAFATPLRVGLILDCARSVVRGEEYSELRKLVAGFGFPENATDMVLQFNVRKPLPLTGIEINRLCSWNAGLLTFVQHAPGHVIQSSPNQMLVSPFVGMKIDVNTAPEERPESSRVHDIIDSILEESLGIFASGGASLWK